MCDFLNNFSSIKYFFKKYIDKKYIKRVNFKNVRCVNNFIIFFAIFKNFFWPPKIFYFFFRVKKKFLKIAKKIIKLFTHRTFLFFFNLLTKQTLKKSEKYFIDNKLFKKSHKNV